MTEPKPPRDFYMDTDFLDRALERCDLGDSDPALVRAYPRKDMLSELTRVIEYSAYAKLVEDLEKLKRVLEKYHATNAGLLALCQRQRTALESSNKTLQHAQEQYLQWYGNEDNLTARTIEHNKACLAETKEMP